MIFAIYTFDWWERFNLNVVNRRISESKFEQDMPHWPYANPDAPSGGTARLSEVDNFDTLNFHVLKGRWPQTIVLIYDSLMTKSGVLGTYLDYAA